MLQKFDRKDYAGRNAHSEWGSILSKDLQLSTELVGESRSCLKS